MRTNLKRPCRAQGLFRRASAPGGFTLVEAVMVLVLISILAAVAVPRFLGTTASEARTFFEGVLAGARHARHFASTHGCPVSFTADGTTLQLARTGNGPPACDGGTTSVSHPADPTQSFAGYLGNQFGSIPPGGVAMNGGSVTFFADGSGSGDLTVQISGGGFTGTIQVHAQTGYVESQ